MSKLKSRGIDPPFLILVGVLVIFGLLILYSASLSLGNKRFDNPNYYFKEQLLKGVLIGLVGFGLALKVPYQFFKKYSFIFLIASIALLILVFLPDVGFAFGGARRWVKLGPIFFQPAEIVKLTFLIYLAAWFEARRKDIGSAFGGLVPFLIIIGIIGVLLLAQPDMGTFGVIALSGLAMYWVAGGRNRHLGFIIALGIISFFALAWIAPYRWQRITVFLNHLENPQGSGYHINQALSAIGIGGIGGVGVGKARSSTYLPEAAGDSIFAVLAEELGLLGVSVTMLLYLFFGVRGYQLARQSPDYFSRLLTVGVISWILIQSFINIASISGSFILTGVPLPFISYGGTALSTTLIAVGIVANISKYRTT
ncbi:hypothetical protein A2833_00020 [Candidatus Azambacteria bacterium RIFCSPHIGHO2_01_FULL_44_55]|uniref:Probable peptidoglycan glycosyltransferase FtsW n=1 Tax=Candidatus Azambacteria bacterium RIFCSPLOWO2_02_FULL_44_14 TaxID=1797306 RepID=A0A1F5CBZ2_9BACT|nr:MAG: hypothetical protein A3A18_00015 [Candidatus Azambacteria bacterium RIFCSPLOWO2_01_FULL_44_84]OGD33256.1 MAG: hypothetical protein A3C78_02835 [Candidatus Azambacteria bacterium RIFCSPHIGHO2_02_FULL_45_18]OGD40267.1 MAG: hypothetical protein A2833_00020 [Candidatus Azambacteria bacterium RIFCSPHIGHO2_01_FULL_44_55]OGD40376.1 MAG: hypothetical protein A3I30_03195 [Candidatus Azambacteria bacterium RIFCSPLOWO2_02_FULL_44_14]OGD51015.1 MAG: hypothetical protein A2608_03145 [Candidatus Azam